MDVLNILQFFNRILLGVEGSILWISIAENECFNLEYV